MIEGVGPRLPAGDIRGVLAFERLPYALQQAEDSNQAADYDRSRKHRQLIRAATPTERALLEHLGYDLSAFVGDRCLLCRVTYFGPVRNRTWPQLVDQEIHHD